MAPTSAKSIFASKQVRSRSAPGTDAELRPNTNYGFQTCVHNDSATEARNTIVRFWHFPGGVGSAGALLDIQTAAIPPMGTVIVTSNVPFPSAPAGDHRCAVVRLYNAMSTDCTIDSSTAALVPSWVAERTISQRSFFSCSRHAITGTTHAPL